MRTLLVLPFLAIAACESGGSPHMDLGHDAGIDAAAPAPLPDLRFKWVGAFSSYSTDLIAGEGNGAWTLNGGETWTPLELGFSDVVLPDGGAADAGNLPGMGEWQVIRFAPPVIVEPMTSVARGGIVTSQLNVLGQSPAGSVLTSLDFDDSGNFDVTTVVPYASSSEYASSATDSLPRAALDTFASTQGTLSRVVTAVAWNGTALEVFAFGREGDTTVYDTQVIDADASTLSAQATSLATSGYVITAMGRSASGYVLVGTRKHGDTTPRSALVSTVADIATGVSSFGQGYAIVGWAWTGGNNGDTVVVWEK